MKKNLWIVGVVILVVAIVGIVAYRNNVSVQMSGNAGSSNICVDTDGGNNASVFGTASYQGASYSDSCSGAYLREYYCVSGTGGYPILVANIACPNGCSNGVCLSSTKKSACVIRSGSAPLASAPQMDVDAGYLKVMKYVATNFTSAQAACTSNDWADLWAGYCSNMPTNKVPSNCPTICNVLYYGASDSIQIGGSASSCSICNGVADGKLPSCANGKVFSYSGTTNASNASCTPYCYGKNCGSNGCGGSCGTCSSGYSCNSTGGCVGGPNCAPKTCASLGKSCGSWPNGTCSGTLNCGTCSSGYVCASGSCGAVSAYCSDSDGGKVYTNRSQLSTYTGWTGYEYCAPNGIHVAESFCDTQTGLLNTESYPCTNLGANYKCVDGACKIA